MTLQIANCTAKTRLWHRAETAAPGRRNSDLKRLKSGDFLASDWQNPGQARDVNRDFAVSPLDALLGVNRLNSGVPRTFPARAANSTEPYYDVDGSGDHNPLDILLVINALNQRKPTVAVALTNDTGASPGANADLRTTDLSVRGKISMVEATELWGRFEGDSDWHDLTEFVAADQSFAIGHDDLVSALGGTPSDGLVNLQLQPRWGQANASVGNEADLTVFYDTTPPQSNFVLSPNFLGAIVTPTATTIEVPLGEKASTFTLIPSKIELFDSTFDGLGNGSSALVPRGISLSADGNSLLIDPPANASSISYRVAVSDGAFEDAAGNLNNAFNAIANHFSDSARSPLTFNQRLEVSSLTKVVKEFTFNVTNPDLFILAGYSSTDESQLDLFSPSGRSLHTWSTGPLGGDLAMGSDNRVLMVEAGEYRLRVAVPALSEVAFKALLGSTLSAMPANQQLQGTFDWFEQDAFSITTTNQDRIYFQNMLAPQTPFRVSLYTQYGRYIAGSTFPEGDVVFSVPKAGRYIAIVESFSQTRPLTYNFKVHLSETIQRTFAFDSDVSSTLVTPGQQIAYNFVAKAGNTYSLDIDSVFADVGFSSPGQFSNNDPGPFPITDGGAGSIIVALNRSDLTSAVANFRLTETPTIAVPPTPPTVNVETLQSGVTLRTIDQEEERFEFTLAGAANGLFALRDLPSSTVFNYRLLTPSGSELQPVSQSDSVKFFRLPVAGQYRLIAAGTVGAEVAFQWQDLSQAALLPVTGESSNTFGSQMYFAYRFEANESRLFGQSLNFADGLTWTLVDQNGHAIFNADMNDELDVPLQVGQPYSLIITRLDEFSSSEFTFRRSSPLNQTSTLALGQLATGNLPARGDRMLFEIPLTAGQFIQLNSLFDPSQVRIQWLDFTNAIGSEARDIDPNVPDLVGLTKTHHVLVQNISDAPVSYSLTFDQAASLQTPPAVLQNFNQIFSGEVGSEVTYQFTVSAGAMFMLDWLLEDNSNLAITITDPSDNASSQEGYDSPFAIADVSGIIEVTISNFNDIAEPFSFRMVSPDSAPVINLGAEQNVTVVPFGVSLFRVALSAATEVFLQSTSDSNNSTWLYRRSSVDLNGVPYEGPYLNGQFLPGEPFVWASNFTADPFNAQFTPLNVASLTSATLDTPLNLPTEPGVTYLIPFTTTAPGTKISAGQYTITDEAGDFILPVMEGFIYELPHAGKYRASFTANSTSTAILLHKQVITTATATLGQPSTGTIPKSGDVNRHSITLNAGSSIALSLRIGDSGFARWIAPNGEVLSPLHDGTTHLPVYTTGTYQLELYAGFDAAPYTFEINDLSAAPAITTSRVEGTIASGLIQFYKISGTPNQLVDMENLTALPVNLRIVDRFGNPLADTGFFALPIYELPADGIAYVAVELATGSNTIDYAFAVSLVTTTAKTATLGQVASGSLAKKFEGVSYSFNLTAPTWVRVAKTSSGQSQLLLNMADGTTRFSSEGFFELLPSGNYSVSIYNTTHNPINYELTIDLLSQAQAIPINQSTSINKSGRYRIDIASPGRYEVQLRDSSNNLLSTSELSITNLFGEEIEFAPRGTFDEADSYWLSFSTLSQLAAGNYSVKVVPIATVTASLSVGTLGEFTLPADGLTEQVVIIRSTPGMRLVVDELEIPAGGTVEARYSDSQFFEWVPFDQLSDVLFNFSGDETLELRISGKGTARVHVTNLNAAPPLPINSDVAVELNARRRAQVWLIPNNVGDTIDLLNKSSAERPVDWMIIDEWGNGVSHAANEPIKFTFVNSQRYALVIMATEPLSTPVSVPFKATMS